MTKTEEEISELLSYVIKAIADTMDELKEGDDPVAPLVVRDLLGNISVDLVTIIFLLKADIKGASQWCKEHDGWGALKVEEAEEPDKWPVITSQGDDPDADPKDPSAWN